MKKETIFNLVGIILGIAIIIAGISIMKNPAETWATHSVDSYRFGADFYTEQYAATRAAAQNAATTARNIDSLGGKLAQYAGLAFIFSGALVCLTYVKNYVCCSASPVEPVEAVETKPTEETAEENNTPQPLEVKETE